MWDLESYSTTLNIVQYFHITILSEGNTYPEPVLDIWKYNIAYNLSGHFEPCDPHTILSDYTSPFWAPWTKVTQAHLKHEILKQYQLHLGTLNQDKQCQTTSGHCAITNWNQYLLQSNMDAHQIHLVN